ncbi:hypothetical protein [Dyadobacter bucti]|uniref:hypothetical protein n=1 Tax=Dyadobacter bucti TaxID=2572203 RepID=UPI0011095E0D|nr:hypothetical protein [Dyadobacter bucti]
MNFFDKVCQEPSRLDKFFGICDDQDGTKAYTDIEDESKWIATVKNENEVELIFTAIDACVIKGNEEEGRRRCDCMLTSNEHLYFIELKDQNRAWKQDAIEQLESTIQFFEQYHDSSVFKHKKAFACNKQQGYFQEIDNELNLRMFRTYGFRIDAQAEVVVV